MVLAENNSQTLDSAATVFEPLLYPCVIGSATTGPTKCEQIQEFVFEEVGFTVIKFSSFGIEVILVLGAADVGPVSPAFVVR